MIRIVKNAYDRISIKYKKENEKVNDLKLSISEMKRKNKETGQSWFDKGAINFLARELRLLRMQKTFLLLQSGQILIMRLENIH